MGIKFSHHAITRKDAPVKVGRVYLQNFKSYEEAEVIFDQQLSIVKSDNASGKTSLAQAIQLSLTCQSDGTQADGKGASDKIRTGADKALITLGIETAKGPMEAVTTYHSSGSRVQVIHPGAGSDEVTVKALTAGFEKFLKTSKERLSCCTDSEYFIKEKPTDQKAILASVILESPYDWDADPESAKMKALADKYLWKLEDAPAPVGAERKRIPAINWRRAAPVVIDEVYGDNKTGVYNLRTQAKATLAGIHIPAMPAKPERDANEVQVKLNILRTNHAKEAKKVKQGGTVQVGRVEQSLAQEQEKLAKAHADLKAARDKQAAIEAELLDGPAMTAHKQLAAKRKEYDKISAEIAELDGDIAAHVQAQEIFRDLLLDDAGNPVDQCPCPTCTQTITRAFISGEIQKRKDEAEAIKVRRDELAAQQGKLGDIAGAEAAIKRQGEKTEEKLAAVKAITAAQERITFIDAAVKDLESALANAKAAEANPIDTTTLDTLAAEIVTWEGRLAPAVQYETTLRQIDEAQKRSDAQQAIVSELETLCAYFGKDGIKARLIKEHIGAFSDKVNEVLSVWGYSARLSIEPYSFEVQTPKTGERYLPLKELSGFEKKAFAVALQSAIAVFSKIKMILVDAADVMVAAQRNKLLGCVKLMLDTGTLDQAIVLMADVSKTAPQKPGCQFYFVEGGKIERL
jgi:AAA domain-containing protein